MPSEDLDHSKLIQELRESVEDLLPELEDFRKSDWYLLKYLQEYYFDVKKSATALRHAREWRIENKLNSILEEDLTSFGQKYSLSYDNKKIDKNGMPVLIVPFGSWKIREAVEGGESGNFLRFAIQMTEINQNRLRKVIEMTDGVVNGVVIIFDLQHYSFTQIMHRQTISLLSDWTKRSEEQYPMQLKTFYVINANKIMPILFNLLKPFMSQNTVTRVKIFNSDTDKWDNYLKELYEIK